MARSLALATAEVSAFEQRRREKEKNPQIVEMNRLDYRQKLLSKLKQAGQLNPLDPRISENKPADKGQPP